MIYLLWIFVLLAALVLFHWQIFSRFKKYGVKYFTPLPIVGNIGPLLLKKTDLSEQIDDLYYKFPKDRFVGRYELMRPILIIQDLDLVKQVTVKDFEYFLDHRPLADANMDPYFGRNMFSLKSQEWKDMRSALSPAFTSSKMRSMVPFMTEVSDMMMKTLKENIKKLGVGYIDIDGRELTTRYTNDVIASCAFGLTVSSHKDVDNEFYHMGRELANFSFSKVLLLICNRSIPWLVKYLGINMLRKVVSNFFRNIIVSTIKERGNKNIIRQDMIHLLMEAKKGKLSFDEKKGESDAGYATAEESHVGRRDVKKDWTEDDLVAQAVLFLIAGFDTVSTTMTFLLHELALNPDVQERVVKEIKEHNNKTGGKFDFNSIQNLTYLDMVVSEVLRKWPPVIATDRVCVQDYNLGRPNSEAKRDYIIRKGEAILLPVWSFHHNPKYFLDPQKFDPERFSEQNRQSIIPLTYAPFGFGPRNCIASRFALCELKVMIYHLLQQIEVSPCERTPIPVTLMKGSIDVRIGKGHWLRFKLREY